MPETSGNWTEMVLGVAKGTLSTLANRLFWEHGWPWGYIFEAPQRGQNSKLGQLLIPLDLYPVMPETSRNWIEMVLGVAKVTLNTPGNRLFWARSYLRGPAEGPKFKMWPYKKYRLRNVPNNVININKVDWTGLESQKKKLEKYSKKSQNRCLQLNISKLGIFLKNRFRSNWRLLASGQKWEKSLEPFWRYLILKRFLG